jgi:transposase
MDKVTTVGIDLAKPVFALYGVDASGPVVPRKATRRAAPARYASAVPPQAFPIYICPTTGPRHCAGLLQQRIENDPAGLI